MLCERERERERKRERERERERERMTERRKETDKPFFLFSSPSLLSSGLKVSNPFSWTELSFGTKCHDE